MYIGKRRSIPNAHSMRIFGCLGTAFDIRPKCRHADNAAMAKSIRRNPMCRAWVAASGSSHGAALGSPRPDRLAVPCPGRPSVTPMAPQRCAQAVAQDRLGFIPQRESGPHPGHPAIWACVIPQRRARIVVGQSCSTAPKPSSIYSAAPNLTRTWTILQRWTWVAPSPTPPQSRWEGNRKQKIGSDCNFFAIADCYRFPQSRIALQKRR